MRDRSHNPVTDIPNVNYENDINYNLQMCRWTLKLTGIWPIVYSRTSKLEKVISIIVLITWFSYLLLSLIPPGRFIIFEKNTLYIRAKMFGPVAFTLTSTIKYLYLVLKGTIFERCIVQVEKDWKMVENITHRGIMLKNASVSRKLSTLCAVFIYAAGLAYHTVMPFLSKGRMKGNTTIRPLIYPGYDAFFDTQSSPNYEIIYSLQCFTGFIRYSVTVAAFSLAVIFITHICGQIQTQIARLKDLIGRKWKNDSYRNPLDGIIRDHAKTLRFAKNVVEALREICLAQIVESTLIICLLEYYCLREWQNSDAIAISTYSIYLISFTFNAFIFCYIGEILSDECSQIGPACYEIDWYTLPPKKASNLILMNAISLYPPKLTGGKIIELSLYTFGSILQNSVVYLNLLRKFSDCKLEKGLSIITMILWLTYLMFSLIPPSLYLIFEKMSLYFRAKLFGPVAYCLLATIKYVYLVMRGSTFASCITHVERDWRMVDNPIHRTIMLQNASISRKLTTLCAVFLYTAGLAFYTVLPFFSKGRVKGNMTTRPLIYPGYDAFLDTQSSPNYEILYFLQCFSAFIRYNVTVAAFSLAVIFVTHICGQIQIQMVRLEDFVGDKNARDMHPHPLNIIIRDHAAILQFAKNVEEALREIFLTQILESTLTICLLEYYCLRKGSIFTNCIIRVERDWKAVDNPNDRSRAIIEILLLDSTQQSQ
ncbi:uncharacterized protein LOC122397930 [Colletes gigas]|uniref:uncharacterized protein LOC122397930 n=1 Tax=Colletes gigas TaxID=935657 RepID=UPI001C9AD8F0|nr:uncharacterized protein LOC122397930 [Colletes gigas]